MNQEISALDQISDRIQTTEKVNQTEIEESFIKLFNMTISPHKKFLLSTSLIDKLKEIP